MAVRNFWVEADVDGYKTMLGGGPRSKDGGMDVVLYQRDDGAIKTAIKLFCRERNGNLTTEIWVDGKKVMTVGTMR